MRLKKLFTMNKIKIFIAFILILKLSTVNSFSENPKMLDKISKNLRCLICQGQSVYDSQSDFAISMKLVIQNKLDEGKSEKQIYEYLKEKYGDWIVFDPELNKKTIALWFIPLILFIFGGLLIIRKVSIK
tara:strand:+ start:454 stop:843 length:390 start_codon:yes stop_codon:yes gene_type:complete